MTVLSARRRGDAWRGTVIGLGSLCVALGIIVQAWVTAFLVGLLCVLAFVLGRREASVGRIFLSVLGLVLLAYAFLGKGAALIGLGPIYVGEIVMAVGLVAVLFGAGHPAVFRSPVVWLLIVFMAWGAATTVPHIPRHGMFALRDGAAWGYGVFAWLVAGVLLRERLVAGVVDQYERIVPWLVLWIPVAAILIRTVPEALPSVPGAEREVLLIGGKAGEMAVHLAGVLAFLSLALPTTRSFLSRRGIGFKAREWMVWGAGLAGTLLLGSVSRGALLSILAALLVIVVLKPLSRVWKVLFLGLLALSGLVVAAEEIRFARGREVSVEQLTTNIVSVAGGGPTSLERSRQWRLDWWGDIADYTISGDHFWTGKGYGINLAESDGYQVLEQGLLRSPHSIHFTFLGRGGVPALLLWIGLNAVFVIGLLRHTFRQRREGDEAWSLLFVWILAFWTAFMVNGSFDVYLEAPQGGIWFWSLMGFGIAAMETRRRDGGTAVATRE